MPRSLAISVVSITVFATGIQGQVLDRTLVPRGHFRAQAHPVFERWDSRYGQEANGTEVEEAIADDLTDPTGLKLFPSTATLISHLESATATTGYAPTLGNTAGHVVHDVTQIDFGGHLGVTDWLTVGFVVPWTETRSAIDVAFAPDSSHLGLSPTLTSSGSVTAFLSALDGARSAAAGYATNQCAGGSGTPACLSATSLSDRVTSFYNGMDGAYAATPFFPLTGSTMAATLAATLAQIDADLAAAGLSPVGVAAPLAIDAMSLDVFNQAASVVGGGIEMSPLENHRTIWQAGDIEVNALARVLEGGDAWRYSLLVGGLVRLPTGLHESPDIVLDLGTGQAQTDIEVHGVARIEGSRFGLAVGGRYGTQGSTTVTRRVAPRETIFAPLATRTELTWEPAAYLGIEASPYFRFTPELSLHVELRYFQKGRDVFTLVDPSSGLDPTVLAWESGVKHQQLAWGLRYDNLDRWRAGETGRPAELHIRLVSSMSGSGGQTPITTRVEGGIRLFRGLWGGS